MVGHDLLLLVNAVDLTVAPTAACPIVDQRSSSDLFQRA